MLKVWQNRGKVHEGEIVREIVYKGEIEQDKAFEESMGKENEKIVQSIAFHALTCQMEIFSLIVLSSANWKEFLFGRMDERI